MFMRLKSVMAWILAYRLMPEGGRLKLDAVASGGGGEPRRHHYVPQFLLRHFANEREQLRTLDLETGRIYPQSIKSAAAQRDYNAVRRQGGQRDQIAEQLLGQMEDYLARAVSLLVSGALTAPTEVPVSVRQVIASFVLMQWARTPAGRHALSATADAKLKGQIREAGPQRLREMFDMVRETPLSDREAAEYWRVLSDEHSYRFTDYNANLIRAMFSNWRERQQELAERAMILIEWSRKTLLIGDQPVLTLPRGDLERIEDLGRVDPLDADLVLVPVCRTKALLIGPTGGIRMIWNRPGTAMLARITNEMGIVAADRYVFSHPDDDLFGEAQDRVRLRERLILSLERLDPIRQ
jgi:Protein of unknown function (DUF4238)